MQNKAIFITGTDTGVGKTVVCAGLATVFKNRGIDVGVMKPVATGAIKHRGKFISSDVKFLIKASGVKDDASLVNPYCVDLPLAPDIAFKLRRKNISIDRIKYCFNELLEKHSLVLIEGIGGLLVPISGNYLVADFIRDLGIPLIIVSRNGLGTINHTLLTVNQARDLGIDILGVVFNRTDKDAKDVSQKTNPATIKKLAGVDILGELPYLKSVCVEKAKIGNLAKAIEKDINLDLILKIPQSINGRYLHNRLSNLDKKYVWHPFTQMSDWNKEESLVVQEARGVYLKDAKGRWFLDGISSLWVNIHGHRKQEIDRSIKKQIDRVAHSTLLGLSNIPSIELAQKLIRIAPKGLTKVFYSDNGSTSVEIALKMAFQYWRQKSAITRQKTRFIYLKNSYHGDTIGSVSVGGIDLFHKIFRPLLFNSFKVEAPYCYRCPVNKIYPVCRLSCLGQLEKTLKKEHKKVAALVIEPIVQGAGGMIVWPRGVLAKMRQLCDKYKVLLIADEVAVGFGRTGKMFACKHEGITPDILCLSKGLSAGYLPLAATLAKENIYNAFLADYADMKTFFHGHSYTGNPLACSAAIASLDVFKKEKTLNKMQPNIKFLKKRLRDFKDLSCVGDIRQKGFMVGIELVKDKKTKEPFPWQDKIGIKVIQETRRQGLILRPLGNCIVLMPPLVISKDELKEMLDITYEAIKVVTEK
ncbi:adenosylmethionine--8-amino-7-oxononanoate transaminase [Candidatus Omnitrophota bacterium]